MINKINELRPCPFCGSEAVLEHIISCSQPASQCRCKECSAATKFFVVGYGYSSDEKAIKAWNRRVRDE